MWRYSEILKPAGRRARFGLGDEADLRETGALHRVDGAADAPIGNVDVAADMHFGQILRRQVLNAARLLDVRLRSEEHTSELQSLMRISYAVFCLNKKKKTLTQHISVTTYPTHTLQKQT